MKNLFGFDNEYLDKYAGMSDSQRFKRLTTKANVDMVLNDFKPFNKVKKQKHNTRTVISYEGTNIDKAVGPIMYNPGSKRSASQILVNSANMRERLDFLPEDERDDKFIELTKQAYVARSEYASAATRFVNHNGTAPMIEAIVSGTDPETAKTGVEIGMQVSVAAQGVIQKVPMVEGVKSYLGSADSVDLADALFTGGIPSSKWGVDMLDKLHKMNRSRSDYNNWMDTFKGQLDTDYLMSRITEADAEILSDSVPMKRYYSAKIEPKDNETSKACDVGHGKIENDDRPEFVEDEKTNDHEYSESNDTLEMDEVSESDKDNFFRDRETDDWAARNAKMSVLSDALYDSLAGKIGKIKSQNPAKRLNARALTSDIDERIYVYKSPMGGKKLSLNMILDTSGSMTGHYINDSVDVINCINKLAHRGVITGNLMLSCSGASSMMPLPIDEAMLPRISAHNGGEGFRHTFAIRWKELKAADYNIALTDGHLTDGHIDKTLMHKEGIYVTGLYTDRSMEANKGRAAKYSNRLTRWFSKSAIRSSAEELVYYLIDQAILNYDMNPRNAA